MKRVLVAILLAFVVGLTLSHPVSAEQGVTAKEIVIGSIQDLSGPLAAWGIQSKMGMEMMAREINEAGGVHGRKIRLVFEDSGYDPKKAIMATNKLISRDKVFCFLGNLGSPTALACLPITTKKKIPAFFPIAAAEGFFKPFNRYSFALNVPYYDHARGMVKWFVENKKVKKVGILYQDDEFGVSFLRGTEAQLAEHKMKLAASESYKRGATDFSSQMAKLKKADVDLVILGTVIRETVGALKEARKIDWKVDICGGIPAFTKYVPLLSKKAGFSADGFYCTGQTPYVYADSKIPFVKEWYKRHEKWFGKAPDMPTMIAYFDLWVLAKAAKEVGPNLTREKLIDAMEKLTNVQDPFGGPPVTFTPKLHLGTHKIFMSQVKDGKFVKISDFFSFR